MAEVTIKVDLSTVATKDLIVELEDRRDNGDDDEAFEFFAQIAEAEGQVAVSLAELEQLNDAFWTAPAEAPAKVRVWLRKTTGRV